LLNPLRSRIARPGFNLTPLLGALLVVSILTACSKASELIRDATSTLRAQAITDGTFKFVNVFSGKVLEVAGASLVNGGPVQQNQDNGTKTQHWKILKTSNGSFKISNLNSNRVLDVNNASTANGAMVQQWQDDGTNDQRFILKELGGGIVSITAKHSGKVLELTDFSSNDGVKVQQWDWVADDTQKWRMVPVVLAPPVAKEWVWWRGVNLAGAEFGEQNLPGVFDIDYVYPYQPEVDYFSAKGMGIFRLPVRWERLQRNLNAALDAAEIVRLDAFIAATTAKGKQVILDPHNYARYRNQLIGSSAVPNTAFANFWERLAVRYKSNNKVIFGLMNEPHDMPTAQWVSAANAAIAAIRRAGANNLILVPGNRWTGAWTWYSSDANGAANATAMLGIQDPNNYTWFEVHQYLDADGSGTNDACVSATVGSERLLAFTNWLRVNNKKGFLGEFSTGKNATCDQALKNMLDYVENNGDVWRGWTYWAAGPWWTPGESLEPVNGVDARQMPILQKYLPR
jgi:endoglucanase